MKAQVSDSIPVLLEDTDEYIEDMDGNNVTAKQKGQDQIKMYGDNGNSFVATLHNVLLAPDLYNWLFSIIKLINSRHNYLFHI